MSRVFTKTMLALAFIFIILICTMTAMADAPRVNIDSTSVVAPGEETALTVGITGSGIIGVQMEISCDERFFSITDIVDIDNENWTIDYKGNSTIQVVAYSNDLSYVDDINLIEINLIAKDYVMLGDRTNIKYYIL